ncbi:MAG TPA: glutamate-5-semialdehyde dehydrogenase [Candidatus Latescibacteria bacterium]|nr:glutamate-5-semialdehyde dehydrogenase [Candidatus Latescibacterota bacterium]
MEIREYIIEKARVAKAASLRLAYIPTKAKDDALMRMADAIEEKRERIKAENARDLAQAEQKGLSRAMIDRLELNDKRITGMAQGLREIAALPDPVGSIHGMVRRPSGILVGRMRVPIGVIGIIYESRPNVTADAAGLCLKAGNAVILRGGSEAINSNICLGKILSDAASSAGIPDGALGMIETTDRTAVTEMLQAEGLIDLVIPRGGKDLIRAVVENSRIPVIKHYEGICHIYVDNEADLKMAEEICFNAKVQRPGVCNAMETLLINVGIAEAFIPKMFERLAEAGVEIKGCERTRRIAPQVKEATEDDWHAEYLDLILSVKLVDTLDEAIDHINRYGSAHTDAIITENYSKARRFITGVDSSSVMVNASTRLSDGGVYGLGAEIGISTDKLHARGPMGVEDLTTYKWVVYGDGQIRE